MQREKVRQVDIASLCGCSAIEVSHAMGGSRMLLEKLLRIYEAATELGYTGKGMAALQARLKNQAAPEVSFTKKMKYGSTLMKVVRKSKCSQYMVNRLITRGDVVGVEVTTVKRVVLAARAIGYHIDEAIMEKLTAYVFPKK